MSTTPVLSSPGIGSGLDIKSLVSGLVSAASGPLNKISKDLQSNSSQISAYGSIASSLSTLQTSVQSLYGSGIQAQTVSSSNTSALTATSDGTATAGTHSISVGQLAQSQQLTSKGFATNDFSFGGSLSFTVGSSGVAQVVNINDNSSLSDVVSAVNSANVGVSASLLNDGTSNHLVFTSGNSGVVNNFSVTGVDSNTSTHLSSLDYVVGGGITSGYAAMTLGQDAHLNVDGVDTTSSSNSVSSVLTGVTLNLSTTTSSAVSVGVVWDSSAISKTVASFVSAYNSSVSTINNSTKYDPSTKSAGVLNGDFLPSSIANQMSRVMSTTFSQMSSTLGSSIFKSTASFTSVGDLGISLNNDGTLALDSAKLTKALTANPSNFMNAFSDFGNSLNSVINSQIDPISGSLTSMATSLESESKSLTNDQVAQQAHMAALQAQYTAQFNALDLMMSKLQGTSSMLTQQLSGLTSNTR